ncbi:hypothetical protein GZ178_03675 [Dermatophilus congolensis]|nr:roadblock/LC7 domain-containing protein [Dermatophilus congolensis]MBO3142581.1 hypothetical protein [Dermatophilus congolensis]MBO3151569.1 hypothetical protein [Dermatophilus congolensis]MBO3161428.1 hypothetical protein [Dermatophilus congolensis]MBO3162854.1 hypothetical protein [Dermatophilus congolensis]MBO3176408.1 hypothetical protein [Dermatophilus congolensis]
MQHIHTAPERPITCRHNVIGSTTGRVFRTSVLLWAPQPAYADQTVRDQCLSQYRRCKEPRVRHKVNIIGIHSFPTGATVSRQEELSLIIANVRASIPELQSVMVASVDGLAIAHDLPENEAERMAAMAATALGLGERISERSTLGELAEGVIRGRNGYIIVYPAGENAVLALAGPSDSNLGLMRIEARAASAKIGALLD